MFTGFLNFMERLGHGRLYHCRFCRVQFYDRREPQPADAAEPQANGQPEVATQADVPQAESSERTA
jgi:hypothetical protein